MLLVEGPKGFEGLKGFEGFKRPFWQKTKLLPVMVYVGGLGFRV